MYCTKNPPNYPAKAKTLDPTLWEKNGDSQTLNLTLQTSTKCCLRKEDKKRHGNPPVSGGWA